MSTPRQKSIQQNALGWVKKSIDDSLQTSESDLKQYIESRDSTLIVDVISRLQTLQGVLLMVEQFGAAMLAEEMVSLARYVESHADEKSDAALEVLMRAVLQLPDYLEHIQSGQQDIPIIILPILNDIRAVRNQDLFSEKLLFLPDLSMHEDTNDSDEVSEEQNQASKLLVKKLRPTYQVALLNLIKEQSIEGSLKHMARVFETLEEKSASEQMARIWWIVSALVESISRQQLELGVSVKNLLGKVDALFRVMLILGEKGLLKRQPVELIKNFLYYIGQPECDGPKAQAIKTAYRLEQFLPSEAARTQALEKIAGPNQALLKTVGEAIKVDVETVKSTLEVYVNSDLSDLEELKSLPDDLRVISDTLAMIGLGPQRQLIKEQIEIVEHILSGESQATDGQLLTIAGDLLQVEQALDHLQRNRIKDGINQVDEGGAAANEAEYDMEDVVSSVVTAALDNIQRTKDAILDFIQDSSNDEKIKACLPLLEETSGAMGMLDQRRSQNVIDDLTRYLVNSDIMDFMEARRLDALSQVVASIEYYLEALGEHRADAENILQFAEVQMETLQAGVKIKDSTAGEEVELEVVEEQPEATAEDDLETALQVDDEQVDKVSVEPVEDNDFLSAEDLSEVLDGEVGEAVQIESEMPVEPSTDIELVEEEAPLDSLELEDLPVETSPQDAIREVDFDSQVAVTAPDDEATADQAAEAADEIELSTPSGLMEEALASGPETEARFGDEPEAVIDSQVEQVNAVDTDDSVEQVVDEVDEIELFVPSSLVDERLDASPETEARLDDEPEAVIDRQAEQVNAVDTDDLAEQVVDEADEIKLFVPGSLVDERLDASPETETRVDDEPEAVIDRQVEQVNAVDTDDSAEQVVEEADEIELSAPSEWMDEALATSPGAEASLDEELEEVVDLQAMEVDDFDAADSAAQESAVERELSIDFEDEALDQAAEQAVLESHEEFASPMELLAEQAANAVDDEASITELEVTDEPGVSGFDSAGEEPVFDEPPGDEETATDFAEFTAPEEPVAATAVSQHEPADELEAEADAELEVPLADVAPEPAGLQVVRVEGDEVVLKPEVDQDILEIYLEEADEEAQNVRESHRKWVEHPDDAEALSDIRRAFHTIKGSGRLVGAVKIAEFAWDFENLLNRVIDRSLPVSEAIVTAVGEAGETLAELVVELRGGEPPQTDIPYLRGVARALLETDPEAIPASGFRPVEYQQGETSTSQRPAVEHVPGTVESAQADDFTETVDSANALDIETADAAEQSAADDFPPDTFVTEPTADVSSATDDDGSSGEPHDPFVEETSSPLPESGAEAVPSTHPEPTDETALSFDPDLLKIYQQEVEQHLSTLSSALKQAEFVGELIPSEPLYRCLHTIHGASRTADISTLAELASLMEKPMKSAATQKLALDAEAIELFSEGHQALHELTEELVQTRQLPAIPEDLRARLQAYTDDIEEHTVEVPEDQAPTGDFVDTLSMMTEEFDEGQDNELLMIFIDEANELLEISDSTFEQWNRNSNDTDFSEVMELQRYLHTLKGGARMANLHEISDLSHEMESVFIAVIDGRLPKGEELVSTLRSSFDMLHTQVDAAENDSALPDPVNYIDNMKRLRLGEQQSGDQVAAPVEAEAPGESSDTEAESPAVPAQHVAEQPARDVVRVRSELLDNLVNSAGEASIYRARMEQQVSGFGSYLNELGQTISRLQYQLRDLESETEAQIHYSHRDQGPRSEEFDPLEMDRYTMIQELSRSLSESVNDLSSLQNMLGDQVKESETLLLQQSRINTELQEGLVKSRMVRFSGLVSRLRRLVRQSCQELGKKAELIVTGEEHEVDNKVLDRMVAPLEHLLRNALAHGIETPMERVKKSKPETGTIIINITRDGSDIVLEVVDDGAGIDIEKVHQRALNQGLINKDHDLSDSELLRLILQPGFSTASQVTQMAGRGVGMDVVEVEIKHLGGSLQIESTPAGSSFIMRLPFTLSINRAILVKAGEENYAIPLINIEGVARLDAERLLDAYQVANPQLEYVDQTFSLHYLPKLVGTALHYRGSHGDSMQSVIFCRAGDARLALHIDDLVGNREIVVKNLGKQLGQVKSISGASILADGSVVLILDIGGLIEQYAENKVSVVYRGQDDNAQLMQRTIMVVDDSITMRRVASKLLQRNDYQVITAKDGMDALTQLEEVKPDLMLLDIEMPRMDGFELASHMKNEESYRDIPIIMITSRTGEKHRQRASEIGVDDYMGKPYREEELLANIRSILDPR